MSREELRSFVESLGERPYRGDQIYLWLYARDASGFEAMTDCGRAFRELLNARARITGVAHVSDRLSPADGTTKFLFALSDGLQIESVLIPPASAFEGDDPGDDEPRSSRERLTLCVSTQVGCPLDCAFCATGTMGYLRNLTPGEIIDQVLTVRRLTGRTITNVVFMGMGEPMLNYDAVMQAGEIMTDGAGIAARRITVSTAGWADAIRRMADERPAHETGRLAAQRGGRNAFGPDARDAPLPAGCVARVTAVLLRADQGPRDIRIHLLRRGQRHAA